MRRAGGTYERKKIISWALYDCANSAFATTVMAGLFPVFLKEYWGSGLDVSVSTLHLGQANSLAAIIGGLLAPFIGYMGDRHHARKKLLFLFAVTGMITTGALSTVPAGNWTLALLLYVIGTLGFAGGNVFYDSLLISVAGEEKMDVVSALGYSLGYLGGGILFALNVWMTLRPETFGFSSVASGVQLSFLSVALWWAIFSIPLLLFVREPRSIPHTGHTHRRSGLQEFKAILVEIGRQRVVLLFLIGYWLYIDGVNTIIVMAVDYGLSLGFDKSALILALLITQFVGFPAAIVFGKLGEKLGTKKSIFIGLGMYVLVCVWGFFMHQEAEFYALAVSIGLVQGGVQSLSRSFYAKIIPPESAGRFFGFYDMLGKFAAVIGPFLMGVVGVVTGNPRHSIIAIILLFVIGGSFLYLADEKSASRLDASRAAT